MAKRLSGSSSASQKPWLFLGAMNFETAGQNQLGAVSTGNPGWSRKCPTAYPVGGYFGQPSCQAIIDGLSRELLIL